VALIDLVLPDGDGFELLHEWHPQKGGMSIVIITANASITKAVQAVREGAYDYLIKPITRDRLLTTVHNAIERARLKQAVKSMPQRPAAGSFFGFIGNSEPMQQAYRKIRSLAQSKASVFVTGESGTGKELCAVAIHSLSPRAGGPFIAINCGAIPKDLMESEIFGHLKGSFTGAISDREGAAKQAHGGTLFLDEICELDFALQTKLLRFLQSGMIQRVGSTATEKVDIRVICATNRSPLDEVKEGRFREDLYYRLHVLPIHLPPLRERGHDILMIARHFLTLYAREEAKGFERIAPAAEATLLGHRWPGNVRELQNAIRQAVVLNDAEVLDAEMLPVLSSAGGAPAGEVVTPVGLDLAGLGHVEPARSFVGKELWQIEKDAIESTIAACGGSVPRAAKVLGVSPSTIYRKRENWTVDLP
jgi:DNA-binding NtrC family response regulator